MITLTLMEVRSRSIICSWVSVATATLQISTSRLPWRKPAFQAYPNGSTSATIALEVNVEAQLTETVPAQGHFLWSHSRAWPSGARQRDRERNQTLYITEYQSQNASYHFRKHTLTTFLSLKERAAWTFFTILPFEKSLGLETWRWVK